MPGMKRDGKGSDAIRIDSARGWVKLVTYGRGNAVDLARCLKYHRFQTVRVKEGKVFEFLHRLRYGYRGKSRTVTKRLG